MDAPAVQEVREVIAAGAIAARIADLHVWRVGRGKSAVTLKVVTHAAADAATVRGAAAEPHIVSSQRGTTQAMLVGKFANACRAKVSLAA